MSQERWLRHVIARMPNGKLPAAWSVRELDEVADRGSGHTPSKKVAAYWNGGVKWLSLRDLQALDRVFIEDTSTSVSSQGLANSSAVLHPPGVVVLSRDASVGHSAITTCEMAVSQHFLSWKCGPEVLNLYLYYWFQYMKPEFDRIASGSTIKTIGLPYFRKLKVILPPASVQRSIAQTLLLWDRALSTLEPLIDAKRSLERGLMEELLTGSWRFKEFEGAPWRELVLGECFEPVERPVDWNDDAVYNLLSIRRRSGGVFLRSRTQGSEIKTKQMFQVRAGDFLISKMQVVHGALGIVRPDFDGMHVSGSYIVLQNRRPQELRTEFFDYLTHLPRMYRQALLSSYGVHIEKMTFNLPWYLRSGIRAPSSLGEQDAIVDLLDSLEREIQLLERLWEALDRQRRGVAELLLTGKVRVPA